MKIAIVYGTRPEQIKLTPVADALKERGVEVEWWWSGQSPDLVNDLPDTYYAGTPKSDWITMYQGVSDVIFEMGESITDKVLNADALLVQGDTATAFAGAVAGFLAEVPVGHIEAGLRTYSSEPYPEEAFRHAIASFATWHFCPDRSSAQNVLVEIGSANSRELSALLVWEAWARSQNVFITGNPIIDTLDSEPFRVLVTLHRRENWGKRIQNALDVLGEFGEQDRVNVRIVRHPNWKNRYDLPSSCVFYNPVGHDEFLRAVRLCDLIVTDSGGLQEEAAHFGVNCIVCRTKTERTALERLGAVRVVNPDDPEQLQSELENSLQKRRVYGSGDAGEQIADILVEELSDAASN